MAELLREHRAQSDAHVRNVEEVFGLMGWEVDDSPCPAIDGLQAEAKANAKKTDNAIIDAILLQGAVEVEHHAHGRVAAVTPTNPADAGNGGMMGRIRDAVS